MRKIVPFNNVLTFNTAVNEITAISLEHSLEKETDSLSGIFNISGEYKMLNGGINPESFSFELPFDIALGMRYDMASMVVDIDDFRYELIDNNKMKVNIDLYIDGEEYIDDSSELLTEDSLVKELNLTSDEDSQREISLPDTTKEMIEEKEAECLIETRELENSNTEGEEEKMNEQGFADELIKDTMENDIKRESELVKELIYNDEEKQNSNNIELNNQNENINTNIINNLSDEENYVTYKVYRIVEGDTLDSILTKYKVSKEELLSYNDNITDLKVGDKLIIPFK